MAAELYRMQLMLAWAQVSEEMYAQLYSNAHAAMRVLEK
jgi:hypothetical protein